VVKKLKIICENCGKPTIVCGLGRPALNLPVINVYDTLTHTRSVGATAEMFHCSKASIYKLLKSNGKTVKQFGVVRAKRRSVKRSKRKSKKD
jgi:hypothetical protein